jgi:hypothetical protein
MDALNSRLDARLAKVEEHLDRVATLVNRLCERFAIPTTPEPAPTTAASPRAVDHGPDSVQPAAEGEDMDVDMPTDPRSEAPVQESAATGQIVEGGCAGQDQVGSPDQASPHQIVSAPRDMPTGSEQPSTVELPRANEVPSALELPSPPPRPITPTLPSELPLPLALALPGSLEQPTAPTVPSDSLPTAPNLPEQSTTPAGEGKLMTDLPTQGPSPSLSVTH